MGKAFIYLIIGMIVMFIFFSVFESTTRQKIDNNKSETFIVSAEDTINLTVDYFKSVEQMVADCKFDFVASDINCYNISNKNSIKTPVKGRLFYFNKMHDSETLRSIMIKEGYRSATLPELLTFSITYPDLQKKFPIASLDTVRCGADDVRVFYLDANSRERFIVSYNDETVWAQSFRFLAIKN